MGEQKLNSRSYSPFSGLLPCWDLKFNGSHKNCNIWVLKEWGFPYNKEGYFNVTTSIFLFSEFWKCRLPNPPPPTLGTPKVVQTKYVFLDSTSQKLIVYNPGLYVRQKSLRTKMWKMVFIWSWIVNNPCKIVVLIFGYVLFIYLLKQLGHRKVLSTLRSLRKALKKYHI